MRIRVLTILLLAATMAVAQPGHRRMRAFTTDTAMVHDPVMAYDKGLYYMMSTGHGIQLMTSPDRKAWTMVPHPVIADIPSWTHDSVPEFKTHIWAPDLFKWHGIPMTARLKRNGKKKLHLTFDADKLLKLFSLASKVSDSSALKALSFLLDNYDDVMVGFELKK